MHFLRIEDGAICGDLVLPSCFCHPSQKIFQKPSNSLSAIVYLSLANFIMLIMHLSNQRVEKRVEVFPPYALKAQSRTIGLLSCN